MGAVVVLVVQGDDGDAIKSGAGKRRDSASFDSCFERRYQSCSWSAKPIVENLSYYCSAGTKCITRCPLWPSVPFFSCLRSCVSTLLDARLKFRPVIASRPREHRKIVIPPGPRLGRSRLVVEGLSKKYGDRTLFSNVSFAVDAGSVVGVVRLFLPLSLLYVVI